MNKKVYNYLFNVTSISNPNIKAFTKSAPFCKAPTSFVALHVYKKYSANMRTAFKLML